MTPTGEQRCYTDAYARSVTTRVRHLEAGDATLVVHKGLEYDKAGAVPAFNPDKDPEEWGVILDLLRTVQKQDKKQWHRIASGLRGVS